jgi:CHASE2 domain-containing sensor protein
MPRKKTRREFWLDVVFGTLFIFGLMLVFTKVTTFRVFDIFDPVGEALGEMQLTDVVFSQLREDPIADERIVMVNIANESRASIAMMIDSISQHNPAVIGFDSFFYVPKEDTLGDIMLSEAFSRVENLVLVSKLIAAPDYTPGSEFKVDSVRYSWEFFNQYADANAFATLDTRAKDQGDLKFCRQFWPKMEVDGEEHMAFAVKLAQYLDSAAVEEFLSRNHETELINFKGNVLDYGATKFGTKYFALDVADVYLGNYIPEMIEGKIVIFAFLGNRLGDRNNLEDKFITPLNASYAGRTLPDMYGGVIHANIVSMILSRDWIYYLDDNIENVIGIILALLNVALFSLIYMRIPKWYDGVTKLFQLVELAGLLFLIVYVFDRYNFVLELGLAFFAIALSGDALEVFYGVIKNIFSKEGRRELFRTEG